MNVCVIGGRGFVGSAVTDRLEESGHDVTTMDPQVGGQNHISASILSEDLDEHLDGFDAVVNLVGLSPMTPPLRGGYRDLHVAGAENVVGACESNDVERLVHMSALGADPDSNILFLKTKGMGEEAVLSSDLDVTVFKPSVIYDHGNELVEYAKLFAPTRLFPRLPTPVQPIYRGDVAELFARTVEDDIEEEVLEIGGPDTMTMSGFVEQVYNAYGYRCYQVPMLPLMKLGLTIMEYVPFAPWGRDQKRFLDFDNTIDGKNGADPYVDLTRFTDWVRDAF